jgi:hypothetical protein
MINHIYVFGPPGTKKTRQIVEENAEKFDTTWNEEWLRLVHGLFDEMENLSDVSVCETNRGT